MAGKIGKSLGNATKNKRKLTRDAVISNGVALAMGSALPVAKTKERFEIVHSLAVPLKKSRTRTFEREKN